MNNCTNKNTTSMPDVQALPNYHQCLPAELHGQADAFIHHLRELPNWSPPECPRCGHPKVEREASKIKRGPFFRCSACNKGFHCIPKHPLARCGSKHLWSVFGHYLLAGRTAQATANAMGISQATVHHWADACDVIMAREFPALNQWWSARQDRTCVEPPAHIAAQAQALLSGLSYFLTTEQAVCPSCGSPEMKRINQRRPDFYCHGCWKTVSLLSGTLLHRLKYPEHWLDFAQGLINGESRSDLQRRTGFCSATCRSWRVRFLKIIEHLGYIELGEWITWQRSRRLAEVQNFVRQGGRMEPVTTSRHYKGSKPAIAGFPMHKWKNDAGS